MVVRRRLILWLIRAYIGKWGKSILISFFAGLLVFFIILYTSHYFLSLVPIYKHSIIGVTGAYTTDSLPTYITDKISRGLTVVNNNGEIKPAIAASWDIQDKGETYIFHLKKDQFLTDGRNVTSDLVNYNFSDVAVSRPDKYTIIFKLKEVYAPFLVTVSRPFLQTGLVGAGNYKIDEVKLNGNFIQSITLIDVNDKFNLITYDFYPSIEALEYAYVLGEVNQVVGLDDIKFNNTTYDKFPNTIVTKKINYTKLVTLFYNNNDNILSDKKVRLALSYALPDDYAVGEKAFLPYSPLSLYYNRDQEDRKQNIEHAKLLLSAANISSNSAGTKNQLKLTIKTLAKYDLVAGELAKNFALINIKTDIVDVDNVPADFQIYLGDFALSADPDQYPLWHSDQQKNITKYKNLRIDKLLEDGRKTTNIDSRKKLYDDFQKYLYEDVPASFLFFPIEYQITRK